MTLGALTGTGGMVALDGVGLESWGKGQTHEELRAQHVVLKEKSVGRQQTTKVHVLTVWLTLWRTSQAKHRQARISRENRPEEKAPGRLAPTELASSLLSGSQTVLTFPSPLSTLSSCHTDSYPLTPEGSPPPNHSFKA